MQVMSTSECVLIILPLPPRILQPNAAYHTTGGHFAKAAATKRYRHLAREATEEQEIETGPWEMVHVTPTFYHKDKRKRDDDNAVAALKAARDGIVGAGLVADDSHEHWITMPAVFNVDKANPRVELLIERIQ